MPDNSGEFGLIDKIRKQFSDIAACNGLESGACEGIGDDCAVIPISDTESFVVTTDMLVEDVHFLRAGTTPFLLGRKSLAVNLSDVAAMGALPFASFLSISLPEGFRSEWADEFMNGYHDISKQYGVVLLGGDTTSSPDRIVINVTAIGRTETDKIKRRSAAKPGDKIFVLGNLGDSSKGLDDIMNGNSDTPAAHIHNNPEPQVKEGVWLGNQPDVHAMIDLSDGLASDLLHVLEESNLASEVTLENIPHNTTIEQAITGGEDYKLLFTADADNTNKICSEFQEKFGYIPTGIGVITEGAAKITWIDNGNIITPSWKGYTHF